MSMQRTTYVSLRCDASGCEAHTPDFALPISRVRRVVHRDGWTSLEVGVRDTEDYCPAHRPSLVQRLAGGDAMIDEPTPTSPPAATPSSTQSFLPMFLGMGAAARCIDCGRDIDE